MELDSKQRAELTDLLLGKFASVMSDKPGRTGLYEHRKKWVMQSRLAHLLIGCLMPIDYREQVRKI